jgi:hypothetical protein
MNAPNVAIFSLFIMANVIRTDMKEVEAKSDGKWIFAKISR